MSKNVDQLTKSVGASALTLGDNEAQVQAVVAQVNAAGGVLGRPIKPVFAYLDATGADFRTQGQAACATFTQDHHVASVVSPINGTEVLPACLTRAGVPLIQTSTSLEGWGSATFARNPFLVAPTIPSADRMARFLVDVLADHKFFAAASAAPSIKIGVLMHDTPDQHHAVDRALAPALAKRGLKIADKAPFRVVTSSSQAADSAAEAQGAVLRFKAEGITHVLDMSIGIFSFYSAAESQNYRPRYGLTTNDQPGTSLATLAPSSQLRDSVAVGWMPVWDVDARHDPGLSAAGKLCMAAMAKGRQDMSSRTAQAAAFGYCEGVYLIRAAAQKARGLTAADFLTGVSALGRSYVPVMGFGTSFGPKRHDGPAKVRLLPYDSPCSCYHYVGPMIDVD